MRSKLTTLVLITLLSFTTFAGYKGKTVGGPAQKKNPFPTASLMRDEHVRLHINNVKYVVRGGKKRLAVEILIVNKDNSSFDFSLGNLQLNVTNSKTKQAEQWSSRNLIAHDRAYQHQPGSGTFSVPSGKQAKADIIFDTKLGTTALKINSGSMTTHHGTFAVPALPTPMTPKGNTQASGTKGKSRLGIKLQTHSSFEMRLLETKSPKGKLTLITLLYNKSNEPFEFYPASTVMSVFNKKANSNQEWISRKMITEGNKYQRQANGAIVLPPKKMVKVHIIFDGKYGPDASKINSGTIHYQSNKEAGSKTISIPGRDL